MYVKDDGVVFRTKLWRPFIDVSHISLFAVFINTDFVNVEIHLRVLKMQNVM